MPQNAASDPGLHCLLGIKQTFGTPLGIGMDMFSTVGSLDVRRSWVNMVFDFHTLQIFQLVIRRSRVRSRPGPTTFFRED